VFAVISTTTVMAKAQVAAARFMTEVAPPPVVSVMRRRKQAPWCLDTIAEDTIAEQLVACGSPSSTDYGFAAAWSLKRMPPPHAHAQPRERAAGFVGKYFSDAHGCQQLVSRRRDVHAQELHKVGA